MRRIFLYVFAVVVALLGYSACEFPVEIVDPPSTPTGLYADSESSQVVLRWDSVTGAESYNIYWSTSSGVYTTTGTRISNVTSPYIHTGLNNGTTYYYIVTAVNAGGESVASIEVYSTPQAPVSSAPTGASAAAGDTRVTLNWDTVADAESYNIYWSTISGVNSEIADRIYGVTSPFTHTGLNNGTTYYYIVTAVNSGGESPPSDEVHATPQISIPPAPAGLTATPGDGQITLNWNSVIDAESYNIYWSTQSGVNSSTGTRISDITSPYIHDDLSNGTTYYYIITAVNAGGESAPSFETSSTPQIPVTDTPSNVSATAGDSQIIIDWEAVEGAESYNIYWSTSRWVNSTTGTKISNVTSPYIHTGLNNGVIYYYIVTAVNAGGESAASTVVQAIPRLPTPDAPAGVTATAGDSQISLNWDSVTGAERYDVYWSTSINVKSTSGNRISDVTSPYVHTGLSNGTTYYYIVTALNEVGYQSAASIEVNATPQIPVSGAPSNVTAAAGDSRVTIYWDPVIDAESYNVYWSTSTGVSIETGNIVSGASSPFAFVGLDNGTTYYFVITAVNAGGESAESIEVNVTPQIPAPGAPANAAATAGDTELTIAWDSVAIAENYNIYWSTSSSVSTTTGTKISDVTSPYIHSDLQNGTVYYYIVTAENAGGESSPSNMISATPQISAPVAPSLRSLARGDGFLRITWDPVATADTYNMYWSTSNGVSIENGIKLSDVTSPYTHTGLTNGTRYYYILTAVNSGGESPPSFQWSHTPQVPAPPSPNGVTAVSGNGQSTLSWNTVAEADSYNIYWSTTSGVSISTGTKISDVTSPYIHTGLTNDTTYYYIVTAENEGGESGSQQVTSTPEIPVYSVRYDDNGASGGTAPSDESYEEGESFSVAANSGGLYKANYIFNGWNTEPDGSGTSYVDGINIPIGTADKTFYAEWILLAEWATIAEAPTKSSNYRSVISSNDGGFYAAGYISSQETHDFGNNITATGENPSHNIVIVKYDSQGTAQWARTQISTNSQAYAEFYDIAEDSSGNVYAVGESHGLGTVGFGNSVTITGCDYEYHTLIVKYDASGTAQWARTIESATGDDYSAGFEGIAIDSSDNIYAIGYTYSNVTLSFGNDVEVTGASSGSSPIIVKYDSNGTALWAKTIVSGPQSSYFTGIALDSSENVVISGNLMGEEPLTFATGISVPGNTSEETAGFIVSYDSEGTANWANGTISTGYSVKYNGLAIDGSDNIITAGYIDGIAEINFGDGVTAAGTSTYRNPLLVKYGPDGTALWARSIISGTDNGEFYGVSTNSNGDICPVGYINGEASHIYQRTITMFNDTVAVSVLGSANIPVIAEYSSSGTANWAQTMINIQTYDYGYFNETAVDNNGNVYAVGRLQVPLYDFGNGVTDTPTDIFSAFFIKFTDY